MKKILILVLSAVFLFSLSGLALAQPDNQSGRAKIWLDIPGATYINSSSDPWLTESDVTSQPDFTLNVQNTAKDALYDAFLVLSVPSTVTPNTWSININGTNFDYSSFLNSGGHTYLAPHGVFEPSGDAKWTELSLGDLLAKSTTGLPVSVSNPTDDLKIHFDAYASSSSTSQNGWYFAPYSHDATYVVPEPVSSALFLLGGGVLGLKKLKRRKA